MAVGKGRELLQSPDPPPGDRGSPKLDPGAPLR